MAWHHQRFTSSQTFVAPASVLWVSGCGGGSGGGGGNSSTLAGGGGGGPGAAVSMAPFFCAIGATLPITIGAGGVGGSVNGNGGYGGDTIVSGGISRRIRLAGGSFGSTPTGGNGGDGGSLPNGTGNVDGGTGAGANGAIYYNYAGAYFGNKTAPVRYSTGSAGGAFGFNGGFVYLEDENDFLRGINGASGAGGGSGGQGPFGVPGAGGSNGAAGGNATDGHGCGGGGGSGNSAGGAGSPGVLDIIWDDANETTPPTEAAIRAELDSNSTKLASIDSKTTNLPSSPAAVGSAMTLTSAYDAAKTAATQTSVNAIPTTPLLAANYTAPDNASIATIKEKVDSIQVDAEGNVSADITRVLGADISGDGSIGNPWGPE